MKYFTLFLIVFLVSCSDLERKQFKFTNNSSFDLDLSITLGSVKNYKVLKKQSIVYYEYWASERDQILDKYPLAVEKISISLSDGRKIEERTCELIKVGQPGCEIDPVGFFSKKYLVGIYKRKVNVGLEFIFTDEFAKTAK